MSKNSKRNRRHKRSKLRKVEPLVSVRKPTEKDIRDFFSKLHDDVPGVIEEDEDGVTFTSDDGLSGFHVDKKP